MRLVRRTREQLLRELYEQQLEERDRVVRLLAEQVEYLRAQLSAPTYTVGTALAGPASAPDPDTSVDVIPAFGGDDRDELEAMHQAGVIDEEEYQRGLAALTAGSNIIE